MSAPARASTAPMSPIALGLVAVAVLVAGAAGFALGQFRATARHHVSSWFSLEKATGAQRAQRQRSQLGVEL